MIEFLSSWIKSLALTIIIVSILEMLLPNNKTKKYIRMVMGIYILYAIIFPFISNKDKFDVNNFSLEEYMETETPVNVNQISMDERIEELYCEELEKDITKKIEKQGYKIENCHVEVQISDQEEETKIKKIKVKIKNKEEKSNQEEKTIENKLVVEVQKIKPINTTTEKSFSEKVSSDENTKITKLDIQNIKKFLIEEYEVNEKCLEIN